jgi:predicted nucleic acid-binding protein
VPAYFFDSSALVKFYVNETGTVWVRSFTDSEDNVIHVASLAKVETVSALTRRLRRRDITQAEFDNACDDLEQDFATQYRVVSLTEEIIEEAATLAKKHGLRAYDAVQLAASLDTSRIVSQIESTQLTLVCADLELNAAARAEGLNVENPNDHG